MTIKVFKVIINSISTVTSSLNEIPSTLIMTNTDGSNPVVLKSTSTLSLQRTSLISIFLQDLGVAWVPNSTYTFTFNSGFMQDEFGNTNPTFSVPFNIPAGPVYQSINVPNNDYINLTYDTPIQGGGGTLNLYTSSGQLVKGNIYSSLGINQGTTISIPIKGLLTPNTSYYITASAGLVTNTYFGQSSAITGTNVSFTTVGEPTFHDLSSNITAISAFSCIAIRVIGFVIISSYFNVKCQIGKITQGIVHISSNSNLIATNNDLRFQVYIPTSLVSQTNNCSFNVILGNQYQQSYSSTTFIVNWGDGYTTTATSVGAQGGAQFNHSYTNAGYYNITVVVPSYRISGISLPQPVNGVYILTKIYDWGLWTIYNFGLQSLLQYQKMLTNVPPYLPDTDVGNYANMLLDCTQFNDPNVKYWFNRTGTKIYYSSGNTPTFISNSKFGNYSLSYGQLITDNISLYSNNFRIDFWFYPTTNTGSITLISDGYKFHDGVIDSNDSNLQPYDYNNFSISYINGKIYPYGNTYGTVLGGGSVNLNQWNHICFIADYSSSGDFGLYINGSRVSYGSIANSLSAASYGLLIQTGINSTTNFGYIDELRIRKTHSDPIPTLASTITVPTTTFTPDIYTQLLLHFENNIQDSSSYDGLFPGNAVMDQMFYGCSSFNQDLSEWNVPSVYSYTDFADASNNLTFPQPPFGQL